MKQARKKAKKKLCKHVQTWFDRTFTYDGKTGKQINGMHTYCADCGKQLDKNK